MQDTHYVRVELEDEPHPPRAYPKAPVAGLSVHPSHIPVPGGRQPVQRLNYPLPRPTIQTAGLPERLIIPAYLPRLPIPIH